MAEAFEIVGKLRLDGQQEVENELQKTKSSLEKVEKGLRAAGAAFTTAGAAGLKLSSDARKLNSQLGQTAITLGVSTGEMRDLALATTNVTFPLESVTATFDVLARAGMRNTEEMQRAANAFDALADATGSSAEQVADILVPALKAFGEQLPQNSADMDKFTWLTKNTTVELSDFGSVMSYVAAYGQDLNLTSEDLIATLAALEAQGISGSAATKVFRTAITEATNEGKSLNEVLGISQEEIDKYKSQMSAATGITDGYAEAANEQYGIMDKLKQKFSELTLVAGSYLEPLEPILAAMTAMGPVMMFLSTTAGTKLIGTLGHLATSWVKAGAAAMKSVAGHVAAAAAKIWAWGASIPIAGIAMAAAGVAALTASILGVMKLVGAFAEGGIVTKPTLALIGERGPEAVVPLSGGTAGLNSAIGSSVNIYVDVKGSVMAEDELADVIYEKFLQRKFRNATLGL